MLSTTALISLTLFISGCVAVEIITKDNDLISNPSTGPIVHYYFGSLPKSCLTLLQFVTVDSLAAVYYPLIVEKPYLSLFFLPLMILISVCLMNLVTAVLVETSMNFTASEQERERLETKEKIKQAGTGRPNGAVLGLDAAGPSFPFMRVRMVRQANESRFLLSGGDLGDLAGLSEFRQALPDLCNLFDEWDEDHDGSITRAELGKLPIDVLPAYLVEVMPVDSTSTCLSPFCHLTYCS